MPEILDYEWAVHLIHKYEEEHALTLTSGDIKSVLRKLMYEKDVECDDETLEDIVEELQYDRL